MSKTQLLTSLPCTSKRSPFHSSCPIWIPETSSRPALLPGLLRSVTEWPRKKGLDGLLHITFKTNQPSLEYPSDLFITPTPSCHHHSPAGVPALGLVSE